VRYEAMRCLQRLGPLAGGAAPSVVPLLADPDQRTMFEAVHVLCAMAPAIVPFLATRLNDPDVEIRRSVAEILRGALHHPYPEVRRSAAAALERAFQRPAAAGR
jgi:HEAT repeat protein